MKNSTNDRKLIRPSTGIGVSAAVAMVVLGTSVPVLSAHSEEPVEPPTPTSITTGETVTESTVETSPETSVATPPVSVTTPSGFATPH